MVGFPGKKDYPNQNNQSGRGPTGCELEHALVFPAGPFLEVEKLRVHIGAPLAVIGLILGRG